MKLAEIIANNSSVHLSQLATDRVLAGDIQTRLSQLGCLDPFADGQFGPVSILALNEFAKARPRAIQRVERVIGWRGYRVSFTSFYRRHKQVQYLEGPLNQLNDRRLG